MKPLMARRVANGDQQTNDLIDVNDDEDIQLIFFRVCFIKNNTNTLVSGHIISNNDYYII